MTSTRTALFALSALVGLGLLSACGPASPAPAAPTGPQVPAGHFVHRGGGSSQFDALVSGNDITGPTVNLTRYVEGTDRAIRGQVFGLTVDVAVNGNKANGLVGSTPLDITATRVEEKLHVEGVIRGPRGALRGLLAEEIGHALALAGKQREHLPHFARNAEAAIDLVADRAELALETKVQILSAALCEAAGQPVVLLFDEADVLAGAAMVSFLTQLRALYVSRREAPAPAAEPSPRAKPSAGQSATAPPCWTNAGC